MMGIIDQDRLRGAARHRPADSAGGLGDVPDDATCGQHPRYLTETADGHDGRTTDHRDPSLPAYWWCPALRLVNVVRSGTQSAAWSTARPFSPWAS